MALLLVLGKCQRAAAAVLGSRCTIGPRSWRRWLNTDLATALRPFYFAVHPDFFGKHPIERQTNEESLKALSAHLESLTAHKFNNLAANKVLKFYMRVNDSTPESFRLVQIEVDKSTLDPKDVIDGILEVCNLTSQSLGDGTVRAGEYNLQGVFRRMETPWPGAKEKETQVNLYKWMSQTAARAQILSQELVELKGEVRRLERMLTQRLGLRQTRYDCGWNIERYYDCLCNLNRLARLHGKELAVLRDRTVVFAPYTGISLEGDVMLFTGDKPSSWFCFISAIAQHETYLKLVPLYEQALSAVLRGIRIKRRNFIPTTEAKAYGNRLLKALTSITDHLNVKRLPERLDLTLKRHKLAIVPEGEQPKVSFTGLLMVPASFSGLAMVEFIVRNLDISRDRIVRYRKDKHIERKLWTQCKEALCLHNLTKDDSVTPDKMILTLRHLLKSESKSFQNISIHVTNYHSVLTDGIICIPWDFMYRKPLRKSL